VIDNAHLAELLEDSDEGEGLDNKFADALVKSKLSAKTDKKKEVSEYY
jgi:hypothetical protein